MAHWEPVIDPEYERLRADYDAAFARFRAEEHRLQAAEEQRLSDDATGEAVRRVDEALAAYRERRGRLAAYLALRQSGAGDRVPQDAVRSLAHRLWEEAGHPMGAADEHWYRAEALIRCGQWQRR